MEETRMCMGLWWGNQRNQNTWKTWAEGEENIEMDFNFKQPIFAYANTHKKPTLAIYFIYLSSQEIVFLRHAA
jgi:hypothetical protein